MSDFEFTAPTVTRHVHRPFGGNVTLHTTFMSEANDDGEDPGLTLTRSDVLSLGKTNRGLVMDAPWLLTLDEAVALRDVLVAHLGLPTAEMS